MSQSLVGWDGANGARVRWEPGELRSRGEEMKVRWIINSLESSSWNRRRKTAGSGGGYEISELIFLSVVSFLSLMQ